MTDSSARSRFAGKVVLVTGAARGIGRATAEAFAREGARLVPSDRDEAALAEMVHDLRAGPHAGGGEIEAVTCDVGVPEQVERMFADVLARFGRIDVLVANAGLIPEATIAQASAALWDATFAVNARGMFLCGKLAAEHMAARGQGAIVFLSSASAHAGQAGQAVYGPSKFAAAGLCKHFAVELASTGVRVNAVSPGTIDTPAVAKLTEEARRKVVAAHPIGRMGRPEEVAAGILFLASDEASFIIGADLPIDGGYVAS